MTKRQMPSYDEAMRVLQESPLVTFTVPGMLARQTITVPAQLVQECMELLSQSSRNERRTIMKNVRRACVLTPSIMEDSADEFRDDYVTDMAFWLAHELLYANGQKHLRKTPYDLAGAAERVLKSETSHD